MGPHWAARPTGDLTHRRQQGKGCRFVDWDAFRRPTPVVGRRPSRALPTSGIRRQVQIGEQDQIAAQEAELLPLRFLA